jgi:hypothetical protein
MAKKQLSRAEVERILNREWTAILEESKLNPAPDALRKLSKRKGLSPEIYVSEGMTITLGVQLQDFGRKFASASAANIKDEVELQAVIQRMRLVRNGLPTEIRKAMKLVAGSLPRRGGPGRQPKMQPQEANQMCDQIATFLRHRHTIKQALKKSSDLTPQLLGKRVSPRTLQKAWNNRE